MRENVIKRVSAPDEADGNIQVEEEELSHS
jgi:hypothetical protein